MKLPKIKKNLLIQELKGEVLIYDQTTNKFYCLNETAKTVFNACDGVKTFADLNLSEEIIYLSLDELNKENLIQSDYVSPFAGMNRREVIRRVGFASMIALPVISSLIAPTAAMASSTGAAFNAACTAPTDCQSGNCFNNTKCCTQTTVNGNPPGTQLTGIGGSPTFNDCAIESQPNAVLMQ